MSYTAERRLLNDRTYTLVSPDEPAPGAPLLLFFHGSRQSANVARNFTDHTFDALSERGIRVAYPDGVGRHFNDARLAFDEQTRLRGVDDVAFARDIATDLGAKRVYACGFSNGGQMVLRLLHDAPGLLSGAAAVAASLPTDANLLPGLGTPVPTPFLAIHGTGDPLVPYEGGDAGLSDQRRGPVRSAMDTARYFATVNGSATHEVSESAGLRVDRWSGGEPVKLITVEGMGHVVPCAREVDPRLGAGTTLLVAADVVADFFGL